MQNAMYALNTYEENNCASLVDMWDLNLFTIVPAHAQTNKYIMLDK